jgi:hypothetical protein
VVRDAAVLLVFGVDVDVPAALGVVAVAQRDVRALVLGVAAIGSGRTSALPRTPTNCFFSFRFTTPPMASAPYDDEAPSFRTSMLSIRLNGMEFRST